MTNKIPPGECLIWWLSQEDYDAIGVPWEPSVDYAPAPDDATEPEPKRYDLSLSPWPEYLKRQYVSRYGRPGRGRLWVDDQFDVVDIGWDDNAPMAKFTARCGGIVIRWMDAVFVRQLPGFLTDVHLIKRWGPPDSGG